MNSFDPALHSRDFRNALGQFGTGVAVISAQNGDRPVGMTVNSFAAVSLDPPLILWSVRSDSKRAPGFLNAKHFAVNILSSEQVDIAQSVATSSPDEDPFAAIPSTPGVHGVPLLDGAVARFECTQEAVFRGGDHEILLGRVDRCSLSDGDPLLFVQGAYSTAEAMAAAPHDEKSSSTAGVAGSSFPELVTAADHGLSRRFDDDRRAFGLSVASSRVLKRLSVGPQTVEQLVASAFLGARAVEDALAELIDAGLVQRTGDTFEQSDAGREVRRQLAERARRLNESALSELSSADVAAAERVLRALAAGPPVGQKTSATEGETS